jgi:hypothetical protein
MSRRRNLERELRENFFRRSRKPFDALESAL